MSGSSDLRCFTVSVADGIAHVQMSRGEQLNTMIPEFWSELPEIARQLDADSRVRVMVLSSTGKHFTAGMELSTFAGRTRAAGVDAGRHNLGRGEFVRHCQDSFTALEQTRFPVLAAIQGGCVGGGVDLATACDMRYATIEAFFVVQETNIGMAADVGTLQRLPKVVPEGIARELVYTGRRMPASRAAQVGLVNEVFDDHESMMAAVMDIAREIAEKSPLAVWGSKKALIYARDHSVTDGLEQIAIWNAAALASGDIAESLTATREKRRADYPDIARGTAVRGTESGQLR